MLLTKSGSHELEFEARTPTGPQLIGAIPLGALAIVFLMAPPPYTAVRLVASGVLLAVAVALVVRSLPRSRPAKLDLERLQLKSPDGREIECGSARAYRLTAAPHLTSETARQAYRVELELGPGQRAVLLEHRDPGRVLGDLAALLQHLDLPVRPGWGLPQDAAPWLLPRGKPAATRVAPEQIRAAPFAAQRAAGLTVLIGTLAIGTIMALMYLARAERGAPTTPLSITLGVTTLAALLLVAAVLLTDEIVLRPEPGARMRLERRTLGVCRSRRTLHAGAIYGAWPVSPAAGEAHHVVVRTASELFAVPCAGSEATRMAAAMMGRR